jgi:hypothetical protein
MLLFSALAVNGLFRIGTIQYSNVLGARISLRLVMWMCFRAGADQKCPVSFSILSEAWRVWSRKFPFGLDVFNRKGPFEGFLRTAEFG